jgi:biotin transport system substrate-specific component
MKTTGNITDFIYPALFAALTIVLGFVSIPIGPVPISGISLGVMLTGSLLSVRQAMYSVLIIILLGAAGLPVFSGFVGGMGVLAGPRGGYYFGFLIGAGVIAFLRGDSNNKTRFFFANVVGGMLIIYVFAVPWLMFATGMGWRDALVTGALPFIMGDMLKALTASALTAVLRKHLLSLRTAK